jgi:uncharacterized damage-inducible protein DinB
MNIIRPSPDEFASYYAAYVGNVPDGDVTELLESQLTEYRALLGGLDDEAALHRYAPGKWSVKQVVGHVTDSERIFSYRALRMARADRTPLPGFDENDFVANARFDERGIGDLLDEFNAVRRASLYLYRSLSDEEAARRGVANGVDTSVRALIYISAGHAAHHLGILRTKYLTASPARRR